MSALSYSDVLTQIAGLVPTNTTASDFLVMFPQAINDAEQRLYRELDLLNTTVRDSSAALSANTRTLALPSVNGTFLVVDEINVITPAGQTNPDLGTRNPATPSTPALLDFLWPSSVNATIPTYFARISDGTAIFGPWPDVGYQVEIVGTVRPASLSPTNVTTLLSTYFPDLLIAAMMVFVSGWMKNYGATVDDPQQGMTWEQHYAKLFASASIEEARKRFRAEGWSSASPSQIASPPRT